MEYYSKRKIEPIYFTLLELQRVLRYIEYDKINLEFLNPLRKEVEDKIKILQQERKNGE